MLMLGNKKLKGQASMIDILMLGLAISILMVSTIYFGDAERRAQAGREDAAYAQSMMNALMMYKADKYGSYPASGTTSLNFSEALNKYLCSGPSPTGDDLKEAASSFLGKTIKPGYNYIFISQRQVSPTLARIVHAWNKQESACLTSIPLTVFDVKLSCGDYNVDPGPPLLGIWPEWQKVLLSDCKTPAP